MEQNGRTLRNPIQKNPTISENFSFSTSQYCSILLETEFKILWISNFSFFNYRNESWAVNIQWRSNFLFVNKTDSSCLTFSRNECVQLWFTAVSSSTLNASVQWMFLLYILFSFFRTLCSSVMSHCIHLYEAYPKNGTCVKRERKKNGEINVVNNKIIATQSVFYKNSHEQKEIDLRLQMVFACESEL